MSAFRSAFAEVARGFLLDQSLLRAWLYFLATLQGVDPQTRAVSVHVEQEHDGWAHVFNFFIHLSSAYRLLLAAGTGVGIILTCVVRESTFNNLHRFCAVLAFGSAVKIGYLVVAMLALQVLSTGTMALELQPLLPLVVVCCLPVPVCAFLALRQRRTFALQDAACRAENAGVDSVIAAVLNYQLVSAYDKRTEQVIGGGSSP